MKKYLLGFVGAFLLLTGSFCSAFEYSFEGWEASSGKIEENGKMVWPHRTETLKFQKAYNKALEEAQKNKKCVERKLLNPDELYGKLTHDARVFVSGGNFTKECEELDALASLSSLPPVTNGNILPGPRTGEEAKSYVMHKLLPGITNWLLVVITAVSVVMGVIAGMFYIFSSGDSEMTKRGKDILVWTVFGFTIAVLSYTIVKFVININFF